MATNLPSPDTTLAVILGASEFPKIKQFSEHYDAFEASARDFEKYLLASDKFGLSSENLLNLFDSDKPQSIIDEQITTFISERLKEQNEISQPLADILVYYVGHGGFTDAGGREFYLALRSTRENNTSGSGYRMATLGKTLRDNTRHLRKYVILDCCFAAAAFENLQAGSAVIESVKQQVDEELPKRGSALLAAASNKETTFFSSNLGYTFLSAALLEILEKGDPEEEDMLSFYTLGQLCRRRVRELSDSEAARPQTHAPDQREGDISKLPFFPNAAKRLDIISSIDEIKHYHKDFSWKPLQLNSLSTCQWLEDILQNLSEAEPPSAEWVLRLRANIEHDISFFCNQSGRAYEDARDVLWLKSERERIVAFENITKRCKLQMDNYMIGLARYGEPIETVNDYVTFWHKTVESFGSTDLAQIRHAYKSLEQLAKNTGELHELFVAFPHRQQRKISDDQELLSRQLLRVQELATSAQMVFGKVETTPSSRKYKQEARDTLGQLQPLLNHISIWIRKEITPIWFEDEILKS